MPTPEPLARGGRARRRRTALPVRSLLLAGAGFAAAWLLTGCQPPAATFVVDTNVDAVDANIGDGTCATAAGTCSLRAAVQEGNANADEGPIRVELGGFEVFALTIAGANENAAATGDLDLTRPFRFVGTGLPRVSASGDRVFDARPGAHLEVNGLELAGSVTGDGGALRAQNANVTIDASVLTGVADDGGAIWSDGGDLTMRGTGISRSSAPTSGAIRTDRIVMQGSSITGSSSTVGSVVNLVQFESTNSIERSTIVGNEAELAAIVGAVGQLTVRDTTIARNSSLSGALINLKPLSIANSIVADQVAGPDCNVPVTSLGHNLESGTSCGFTAPSDLQSAAAGFAPGLEPAGTTSILPLAGGPAVDSGSGCLAFDQAGAARPLDGDADGVAVCDRGAVEVVAQPLSLLVDSTTDAVDADPGDGFCATSAGACTLRAAVMEANVRNTTDVIELPAGATHGLSIAGIGEDGAATGDLDISGNLTIRSTSEGGVLARVDGNDVDRVFDVHTGTVVVQLLAIEDGTEPAGGGGLRVGDDASVELDRSAVQANNGAAGGGGVRVIGSLDVARSSFSSNDGGARGGGIMVDAGGSLQLWTSTVASNRGTTGAALSVVAGGSAAVVDTTLAGNNGVGVEKVGSLLIENSIISGHAAGNCSAPLGSWGWNLDSGTSCGFTAPGDAQAVEPLLGTLADNGGPTRTRKPGVGSPAIGTGTCNTPLDQRGIARPQGGTCDKGSVEQ